MTGRALTSTDPYSFTQDIPWVNHEWLSELIMATAYQIAGPTGLALLKGILVLLTFLLILSAYVDASPPVLAVALLVLVEGKGRVTATLLPQLWSLFAMALLVRWLLAGTRRWWLIAFPALFLFWVNVHGGWIVGAGVLVIWIATNLWTDRSSRQLLMA